MEAAQGTVEVIEVEVRTSGKVTELKEYRDALDNVNMRKLSAQLKERMKKKVSP